MAKDEQIPEFFTRSIVEGIGLFAAGRRAWPLLGDMTLAAFAATAVVGAVELSQKNDSLFALGCLTGSLALYLVVMILGGRQVAADASAQATSALERHARALKALTDAADANDRQALQWAISEAHALALDRETCVELRRALITFDALVQEEAKRSS